MEGKEREATESGGGKRVEEKKAIEFGCSFKVGCEVRLWVKMGTWRWSLVLGGILEGL